MLRSLHIENVAVIRAADIDFYNGFCVLTGETGAGKSLIIDSMNMLLGNKTSRDLIRYGESSATVAAYFDDVGPSVTSLLEELGLESEDGALYLQRTLKADGRSTVRLNGRPITQGMQKEVARLLINIHGQNDNQRLMQQEMHLSLVDSMADVEPVLSRYRAVYADLVECRRMRKTLDMDLGEAVRLRDMLEFQVREIDALKLKVGEEEVLTERSVKLNNIEKIQKQIQFAYRAVHGGEKGGGISALLERAAASLRQIAAIVPEAEGLATRLVDCQYEIEDVAEEAMAYALEEEGNPEAEINRIEGRLDAISKLKRKYGSSIADILAFRDKAAQQLEQIDCRDDRIAELEEKMATLTAQARKIAAELSALRRCAAEGMTEQIAEVLRFLDMPKVRFEIRLSTTDTLGPDGMDDAEFLIAANAGEPLHSMVKTASGGELARIMLAIKSVLANRDGVDTVIFDEVDTGISGKTSSKVGIKLKHISRDLQVICVTHSAQIAALADHHYLIEKSERDERTETAVHELAQEGRIEELSRILGGLDVTEAQRNTARQLLEEGRTY